MADMDLVLRVWGEHGLCVEVSPDGDGLDMARIVAKDDGTTKPIADFVLDFDAAEKLAEALTRFVAFERERIAREVG